MGGHSSCFNQFVSHPPTLKQTPDGVIVFGVIPPGLHSNSALALHLCGCVGLGDASRCLSNVAMLILNVNKSLSSVHSARTRIESTHHCFSDMGKSCPPRPSWTRRPTSAKVREAEASGGNEAGSLVHTQLAAAAQNYVTVSSAC